MRDETISHCEIFQNWYFMYVHSKIIALLQVIDFVTLLPFLEVLLKCVFILLLILIYINSNLIFVKKLLKESLGNIKYIKRFMLELYSIYMCQVLKFCSKERENIILFLVDNDIL